MSPFAMNRSEARTLGRAVAEDFDRQLQSAIGAEAHHSWDGELALRWAVLLRAVDSFRHTGQAMNGLTTMVRHQQDKRWFYSNDRSWPFSFLNICESIGIDPSCVKKHLFAQSPQPTTSPLLKTRAAHA